MTIPRDWNWPTKEKFLDDPLSYLADMYSALAEEIYAPSWRLDATLPVAPAATSLAVVTPIDRLPVQITVSTDWLTTTSVTLVSTAGFTINFGTAAPGGGGNVSYIIVVPEAGPA